MLSLSTKEQKCNAWERTSDYQKKENSKGAHF